MAAKQASVAIAGRRTGLARFLRRNLVGWLFLLPAVLLFYFFAWVPIVSGLLLSLKEVSLTGPSEFVGLQNYNIIFNDRLFFLAWRNTLYFVLLGLLFGYAVPIIMALLVQEIPWGKAFFRGSLYVPSIVPGVVVSILWMLVFRPSNGLLNLMLKALHLPTGQWIYSPISAMPSLVLMATWAGAGATHIIYLAALQNVPAELYDAAEVDGASVLQRLRYITLPQLRTVMLIILLLQIIGTVQTFTEPFIMTGGGPGNATLTVMLQIYRYAFVDFRFGIAAAAGMILFLFLVVVSMLYFRIMRTQGSGA